MRPSFRFNNGGLLISRGRGKHPERIIDSIELIFIRTGTLFIYEENTKFQLNSGDYLLLFPRRRHGGFRNYSKDLSFFWFHFSGNPKKLMQLPQTGQVSRPEHFAQYSTLLLGEQRENDNQKACDLLLALLLNEIIHHVSVTNNNTREYLAEAVEKMIRLDFPDHISTSVISKRLSRNSTYLGRIFRKKYGCTITEYLIATRLKNAARKLQETPMSIKEIAFSCGFNDIVYFRRCFQRHYSKIGRAHV